MLQALGIPGTYGLHPVAVDAINYADRAMRADDPDMLQKAKSVLDAAAETLNKVLVGSEYLKNSNALALTYQEVSAHLSPTYTPPSSTTSSGSIMDDIEALFTKRDVPSVREEEEVFTAQKTQDSPKTLLEILGVTKTAEPVDLGTQYYQAAINVEAPPRQLEPEEMPAYAAAIAQGLDPDEAVGAARTSTFVRQVASSGDIASTLTKPKAGSAAQPLLSSKDISDLASMFAGVIGDIGAAQLKVQLAKQQAAGKRIQLPADVKKEISRQTGTPWGTIAIGGIGLLAVGVLAYAFTRS